MATEEIGERGLADRAHIMTWVTHYIGIHKAASDGSAKIGSLLPQPGFAHQVDRADPGGHEELEERHVSTHPPTLCLFCGVSDPMLEAGNLAMATAPVGSSKNNAPIKAHANSGSNDNSANKSAAVPSRKNSNVSKVSFERPSPAPVPACQACVPDCLPAHPLHNHRPLHRLLRWRW